MKYKVTKQVSSQRGGIETTHIWGKENRAPQQTTSTRERERESREGEEEVELPTSRTAPVRKPHSSNESAVAWNSRIMFVQ